MPRTATCPWCDRRKADASQPLPIPPSTVTRPRLHIASAVSLYRHDYDAFPNHDSRACLSRSNPSYIGNAAFCTLFCVVGAPFAALWPSRCLFDLGLLFLRYWLQRPRRIHRYLMPIVQRLNSEPTVAPELAENIQWGWASTVLEVAGVISSGHS